MYLIDMLRLDPRTSDAVVRLLTSDSVLTVGFGLHGDVARISGRACVPEAGG